MNVLVQVLESFESTSTFPYTANVGLYLCVIVLIGGFELDVPEQAFQQLATDMPRSITRQIEIQRWIGYLLFLIQPYDALSDVFKRFIF